MAADVEAGAECLWHEAWAGWRDWNMGSRPFFWRWATRDHQAVRDGYSPCMSTSPQQYRRPQPHEKNEEVCQMVAAKLAVI